MNTLLDRALEALSKCLAHEITYEELIEDEAYKAMVEPNEILNQMPMKEAKDIEC